MVSGEKMIDDGLGAEPKYIAGFQSGYVKELSSFL